MEEKDLGHLTIETEFDRYLMAEDGYEPPVFVPIHHLISRKHTREQISRLFEGVTPEQNPCLHPAVPLGYYVICMPESHKKGWR